MKKSVFTYKAYGKNNSIEVEILLDINRELTDNDDNNLRECVDKLVTALNKETTKLDPETKETFEKTKKELLQLFGDKATFVEEIPNEYCNCYVCSLTSPWFIVTTSKGRIKIGWRKRVINIDWTDSVIEENAETLFPKEDVTKYEKGIHAWGYEKAREYLNKLLN